MVWTLGQVPDVYTLPDIKLEVAGAGWLADASVTSWDLDRELVASVVPGTLRSRNGLSIGSASVAIVNDGPTVTPWSRDVDRLVTQELTPASLYAEDEAGETLPLGSWVLDPINGSLLARATTIELIEAQYAGRQLPQALPAYNNPPFSEEMPLDPIWAVSRLLEQAGFPAIPAPWPSALLVVPMDGGVDAIAPQSGVKGNAYSVSGEVTGWEILPGDTAIGASNGSGIVASASGDTGGVPVTNILATGQSIYVTLNVVGTVYLLDLAQGWLIEVVNDRNTDTYTVSCSNNLGTPGDTQTFVGELSSHWKNRVQLEIRRPFIIDQINGPTWTSLQVRARSAAVGWSLWSTDATDHSPAADGLELIYVVGGVALPGTGISDPAPPGQFAALQVTTVAPISLWDAPRALLKPLGGDAGLPWVPAGMDTWTAIRDICSAWLGAAIMGVDGIPRVLDRDDLAGVNTLGDSVIVDDEWEDLAWTIDPGDWTDRIEVNYNAPNVLEADLGSSTLAPQAWRAAEVITVPPLTTITVAATFEDCAAVGVFPLFITPASPSAFWSQSSNIFAFDNPEGTGVPLAVSNIRATAKQTSATSAVIEVRNLTSAPMYLVDGNGEPGLILRARTVATFMTAQQIERGLPAAEATNPLTVDLAAWVQRDQDATAIADYLWGRLSRTGLWKASSVRCRLDWSHDLARILRLLDPATGLEVKALVTKVSLTGSADEIAQLLDLVLLPWTWADFDALTAATPALDTWAEFDTAYSDRTWADLDADPLWNGA